MHDFVRKFAELQHIVAARGSDPLISPQRPSEDSRSIEAISRGSVPEFAALFDRTSEVVRAELADLLPARARADAVFAASYLEVWWLAGCHTAPPVDVLGWITRIVRRRTADAWAASGHDAGERPSAILAASPSYAELELAALLGRPVGRLTGD